MLARLPFNELTAAGMKINSRLLAGDYWRWLTPALLHANWLHLLMNCTTLWAVGPIMERKCGSWGLAAVYLCGAFGGTLASFMFSSANSLGASGAVFGVIGASLALSERGENVGQWRSVLVRPPLPPPLGAAPLRSAPPCPAAVVLSPQQVHGR